MKIKTTSPYTNVPVSVVLAADLVKKWFGGKKQPEILEQSESFSGKDFAGVRYEQLLPFGNEIEELDGADADELRLIPASGKSKVAVSKISGLPFGPFCVFETRLISKWQLEAATFLRSVPFAL